jgi:hypothetical protein
MWQATLFLPVSGIFLSVQANNIHNIYIYLMFTLNMTLV